MKVYQSNFQTKHWRFWKIQKIREDRRVLKDYWRFAFLSLTVCNLYKTLIESQFLISYSKQLMSNLIFAFWKTFFSCFTEIREFTSIKLKQRRVCSFEFSINNLLTLSAREKRLKTFIHHLLFLALLSLHKPELCKAKNFLPFLNQDDN